MVLITVIESTREANGLEWQCRCRGCRTTGRCRRAYREPKGLEWTVFDSESVIEGARVSSIEPREFQRVPLIQFLEKALHIILRRNE